MIVRSVFPGSPVAFALPRDRAALDASYLPTERDWLRVNLISSIDGSAAGADGTSGSLSRGADRAVLGAIRRASDLVLVGAATVRAEGYVLPRSVPLGIVTAHGDLTGHAVPADAATGRVLVVCPAAAAERVAQTFDVPNADIVVLPSGADGIPASTVVEELRARGFRSMVCEGGPTLAGALVAAGLVDELCLSVAPALSPRRVPVLTGDFPPSARTLTRLAVDDAGVTYSGWSLA